MLVLLTACAEREPLADIWGVVEAPPILHPVATELPPPRAAVSLPNDLTRELRVEPIEVDFGTLDPGQGATATIRLHNGGPHMVDILDVEDDSLTLTVATGGRLRLQPGETARLILGWTAGPTYRLDASVTFVAADDTGQRVSWEVPVHGRVFEEPRGELIAAPQEDTAVGVGCDRLTKLDLVNTGVPTLTITGLVVAGRSDLWQLSTWGGGAPSFPIEIPKSDSVPFELHFAPKAAGAQTARISVLVAGAGGAVDPVEVSGLGYEDGEVVDEFTVDYAATATVLLAVNAEAVDELLPALPALFEAMAGLPRPWRLAVVTRDDGAVEGDVAYIDDSFELDAAVAAASAMVEGAEGDNDALLETLEAAVTANADWLLDEQGDWDASRLHLVAVNADQEQSTRSVPGYVAAYRAAKPDSAGVLVHGFAGAPPKGCTSEERSAEPSEALYEAVELTGGVFWDWCEPWEDGVAALAASMASGSTMYTLSLPPDPAQLRVYVDGVEVTEGWTLDLVTRTLAFDEATLPPDGAVVRVVYWTAMECPDGE